MGIGTATVAAQIVSILACPFAFYLGVKWGMHEARRQMGSGMTLRRYVE